MGQPAVNKEQPQFTDMPVGEILRRTRMHYGQSLEDIERALRIRSTQIEAIELGEYENLPGRVYAIGFVRSYSEYLGLDGDKMVHLFKTQAGGRAHEPELHFPAAASESKIPPVWLVAASVLFAVVIIAGWWGLHSRDRSIVEDIPEVPANLKTALNETSPPGEQAQGTISAEDMPLTIPKPVPPPVPKGIILNINQNSWVEIKDKSGKALVSRVLKAGDKYYVPDRPDLLMSLGNAGGIRIEVDGVLLESLGGRGEVRRNIPLDAKVLKQRFASDKQGSPEQNEDGSITIP